ncbi:MarC family protein [uncultured Roseobacter sp.]|uniref:MarC family protein n=1 Tax=uncultured Roseobacter sp. TaxID=114847 RepID=UPI00262E1E23|nr:MarC family protein [uncultured Roseobacter sp.]
MMDTAFFITAFVTMFVVIDPIGLAPLFVALTQGMTDAARRRIAIRATGIGVAILLAFAGFGEALLAFIGISMPAFRVAGGILLFLTALDMLFERRTRRREDQSEEEHNDPSVFPLAIPLIAGPGAIASVILLMGQRPDWEGTAHVLGATGIVMLIVLGFFLASGVIERALGKTGVTVVTRLLGMLLAALSVQFVLDGLSAFGFGPGPG